MVTVAITTIRSEIALKSGVEINAEAIVVKQRVVDIKQEHDFLSTGHVKPLLQWDTNTMTHHLRDSSARDRLQTLSTVNPYSAITVSPGAEAP